MTFLWPPMLLLLLAIPLGVALYVAGERRRRRRLAAYRGPQAEAAADKGRTDRPTRLRRRIPAALMLVGLVFLVVAMARPEGVVRIPRIESTVILSFDVSGSMAATDLAPSRMEAAKAAARAFVGQQPTSVKIGVVAFSDSGFSVQPPTDDQAQVIAAIDRLTPERGTSLGQGILTSLATIAAAEDDPAAGYYSNRSPAPTVAPTPMPAGSYTSAVIVLLSDGENTTAPDPIQAATAARDRGVRIFTVGIGSTAGSTIEVEGFKIHSQLDEAMLGKIAEVTGGAYHAAADPAELTAIYQGLDTRLVIRPETMEVTSLVAGLGLLILLVGATVSLLWLRRLPLMDLLTPLALTLLLLLPVLVVARLVILRRHRTGIRFSSLSLVHQAAPGASRLRRHLPFALFLIGIASLIVAMARPVSIVSIPSGQTTVILAIDVSRSMCATDIPPNRLLAAEAAAKAFIERQGPNTQIGIVAFAGFAETLQSPTTDREVLLDVIETLTTGRRTAVGSAILKSLDAINEVDPSVAASLNDHDSPDTAPVPVPKGAYAAAIIVLLTDGASNAGPLPVDAAQQAAARGVRIYTIGFGTADPGADNPICGQQFIGGEPAASPDFGGFGGFGGGGGRDPGAAGGGGGGPGFRRAIDEGTLKDVADATGGTYHTAESASELDTVFQNLPTNLITKHEVTELSVVFVVIGALFIALAIFLGQAWRPLP